MKAAILLLLIAGCSYPQPEYQSHYSCCTGAEKFTRHNVVTPYCGEGRVKPSGECMR